MKERARLLLMCVHERRLRAQGFFCIAGVDEVGRGSLAGPVLAAACILPENALFHGINDSKKLTPHLRESLYTQILSCPGVYWGIGMSDEETIDQVNILQATLLAMRKAVGALCPKPHYLLIDGNQLPQCEIPAEAIIRGDACSISIAAASIIAKVTRDEWMKKLEKRWPGYGFAEHKGYGTRKHLDAIRRMGPCPAHRRSFAPLHQMDKI